MNKYPDVLPLPLRRSYGFDPVNNILTTEMKSGRSRQRISFDKVPTFSTMSWILPVTKAQYFEAWAVGIAKADWFIMPLTTPLGLLDTEVRFAETLKGPRLVGVNLWEYEAKIEVRERPVLPPDWIELLPDYILLMDVFDRAINQKWPQA